MFVRSVRIVRDVRVVRVVPFSFALAALLVVTGPPLIGARPLSDRVEIRRDTFGVPHILAEDEEAAGYAFGYAMAEDHALELGRRYLAARGEAARHFGASERDSDLAMQRFDNRRAARRTFDDDTGRRFRRWLRGFAAGVNRYTDEHRDTLPSWMPVVEPWDPIAYGRMFAVLGAARPPARLIEKYDADPFRLKPEATDTPGGTEAADAAGSNAFALAGSKTTTGRPILLGNPHLGWSALYWEAHVTVAGGINFYGSTLVGIPVLRAGFNDRLGYVQTNNGPDLEDIYSLPAGHPVERREVVVAVRQPDGAIVSERRDYEHTRLGPVIHRTADRLFVLRSINLEWGRQYEGFYELQRARSLRDFRRTLGRGLAVTSNYTYADVEGNILYAWHARLPRRPDTSVDYRLDVPGDTRRLFWKGVHRARDLPSLLNPPGGYVQNANNPPWWTTLRATIDPADYPPYIETGELSLRAQLALGALDATPRFSPETARDLKFSTRVLAAERLLPELLAAGAAAEPASEPLRAGLATLAGWDRRVDAGSRGAVLFERFAAIHEAQRPRFAVPFDPAQPLATPRGLADPPAALAALERAVSDVRAQFGSERVAWGDVHRFRAGGLDLPGDGASGRHGLFRVVTFDPAPDGRRVAGFGDAWILLVHFTRPIEAWSVLAYGQTQDIASPHSRDQLHMFARHELRPVWFSEQAIAAHTERRYRPGS